MFIAIISITVCLIIVPIIFEILTKGWSNTIIVNAIREFPGDRSAGGNQGFGRFDVFSYSLMILRSFVSVIFGGAIGALTSLFGYVLLEKLFDAGTAYWLSGLLGGLVAGFCAGEVRGWAEVNHGAFAGLISPLIVIAFVVSYGTKLSFPWWLIVLQFTFSIVAGMLGGRLATVLPLHAATSIQSRPR
jgi:hypothetical protein